MISKNQIKFIKSLHLKKQRDAEKLFIAEGPKTILEIIELNPGICHEVYGTDRFYTENSPLFEKNNVSFNLITEDELNQISCMHSPQAVLAVCKYLEEQKPVINIHKQFGFYLDKISDPGNFGTLMRLCSWFGIQDLFCAPGTADLYNPKCIQASMGSFLKVNVLYTDIKEVKKLLSVQNVYAAVLNGENIYQTTLKSGLIVIGNEGAGISDEVLAECSHFISVPCAGNTTESLNAALAASIIAGEFYRQSI